MEYFMFSYAFNRSDAKIKISSIAQPIKEHLLKLIFWGNLDDFWIDDIIDCLDQIQDIKLIKKQKLKKEHYFDFMFDSIFGDNDRHYFYTRALNRLKKKMRVPPVNVIDCEKFDNMLKFLYHEFAVLLETKNLSDEKIKSLIHECIL